MDVLFMILLLIPICSAITSLITEGIKKTFNMTKNLNIVVLVVALIVGCIITVIYYITNGIPFTLLHIIYIFIIGIFNWLGAMLGYDKVVQTVTQIKKNNENNSLQ